LHSTFITFASTIATTTCHEVPQRLQTDSISVPMAGFMRAEPNPNAPKTAEQEAGSVGKGAAAAPEAPERAGSPGIDDRTGSSRSGRSVCEML
jgi:hypothetical protein